MVYSQKLLIFEKIYEKFPNLSIKRYSDEEDLDHIHFFQVLYPDYIKVRVYSISNNSYLNGVILWYLVKENWQFISHFNTDIEYVYASLVFNNKKELKNLVNEICQYLSNKYPVVHSFHAGLDYVIMRREDHDHSLTYVELSPVKCDYLEIRINEVFLLNNMISSGSPFSRTVGYSIITYKDAQYILPLYIS